MSIRVLPGLLARRLVLGITLLALAGCEVSHRAPVKSRFTAQSCTNLGNALDAPQEGDWGFRIMDEHFDLIADAGFDAVRIPVRWSAHAEDEAPYQINPAFFDRVDLAVEQALARGLEVVINIHHYNDIYADPTGHRDRFIALWEQIAAHYQNHDLALHFELLNEPRNALGGAYLNELLEEAVETIRKTNPDRILIVGGGKWNSLEGLAGLDLPADKNLVATFHYYDPFAFTHQGAGFLDSPPPEGRAWGDAEDRAALKWASRQAKAQGERLGVPVWLGEFGVYQDVDDAQRLAWYAAVREAFEAKGIGWCAWNFASNFPLWDGEAEAWKPGALEALGLTGETAQADAGS